MAGAISSGSAHGPGKEDDDNLSSNSTSASTASFSLSNASTGNIAQRSDGSQHGSSINSIKRPSSVLNFYSSSGSNYSGHAPFPGVSSTITTTTAAANGGGSDSALTMMTKGRATGSTSSASGSTSGSGSGSNSEALLSMSQQHQHQRQQHQQHAAAASFATSSTSNSTMPAAVPGTSDNLDASNSGGSGRKSKTKNVNNNGGNKVIKKKDTAYRYKKKSGDPGSDGGSAAAAASTSDAAPPAISIELELEQNDGRRKSSVAMARGYSNSSVTSTRSLPSRATRSSKRKYVEQSSDSDEDTPDEDLLNPDIPSSRRKGKRRETAGINNTTHADDEGTSTTPPSRSTTPEDMSNAGSNHLLKPKQLNGSRAGSAESTSGLSIRLRPSASRHSLKSKSSSSSNKSKRKKKRIETSAEPSPRMVSTSVLHSDATPYNSQDEHETTLRAVEMLKEEAASTSDSSVSTPLASRFTTNSDRPSALEGIPLAKEIRAKLEPTSEPEDDAKPSLHLKREERAFSDTSMQDGSRAPTVTTSRPTSAEVEDVQSDAQQQQQQFLATSSRASVSSEPAGLSVPSANARSVSAMDGGDELSTGAQSTAMPSPIDEANKQLGSSAKKPFPPVPKKKRGRPPKKRPLSETPGPTEEDTAKSSATNAASANSEEEVPTIKTKYRATLSRERELIEAGTHPLFLEALVEYDKIRQKKIGVLQTVLHAKEDAIRKSLEAREKSLWESWQDERRKLWYEMTLSYSRKQRQLVFEKDTMEAEAIDPTGLFGTAKAILWPDRDPAYVSSQLPVVEPLIRVPIPAKPPPKGRTRSSNRAPIQAGEALITPLNTTAAQGISSLSSDEISLDLEIMGLSSRKVQDNWFHNAVVPESDGMPVDLPEESKPSKKEEESQEEGVVRELSIDDEYLLPKVENAAQPPLPPPPAYPPPAPYDYVWPPYPDPRYPNNPHYQPYYPPPQPSIEASQSNFNFPSGSIKDVPARQSSKVFSFPQGGRQSFDGKEGHSRDDAILIDDEQLSSPIEAYNRQPQEIVRVAGQHVRQPSKSVPQHTAHGPAAPSEAVHQHRELARIEAQKSVSRATTFENRASHRYPPNAYEPDYRHASDGRPEEEQYYGSPVIQDSPGSRAHASPPQHDNFAQRERRISNTERDLHYRKTPEQSQRWPQQSVPSRYRPYYEPTHAPSARLEEASLQYGYGPDVLFDPWGRPIDPYYAPAYLHPAFSEAGADMHLATRGETLPPPQELYRDGDNRSQYRQYSAQTDEPFYPAYGPPYTHQAPPEFRPDDRYPPPPRRTSKGSGDGDHSRRPGYSSTYSPQHR